MSIAADRRAPPAAVDRRDSPELHGRFLRRDRRRRSSACGSRRWAHSRSGQLLGNLDPVREHDGRAAAAARLRARPRRRGTFAWRRGPGPCGPPSCSQRRNTPARGRSRGTRGTAQGRLGSVARGTTLRRVRTAINSLPRVVIGTSAILPPASDSSFSYSRMTSSSVCASSRVLNTFFSGSLSLQYPGGRSGCEADRFRGLAAARWADLACSSRCRETVGRPSPQPLVGLVGVGAARARVQIQPGSGPHICRVTPLRSLPAQPVPPPGPRGARTDRRPHRRRPSVECHRAAGQRAPPRAPP